MDVLVKVQGRYSSIVLACLITACGGGGGGGSAGPANVVETDPEPEQLKAGLFTDAPVTGLRYVQGHREGYTENGVFQYDANHSDPICFYIGNVLLGCARGGEIITPYDLSSAGSPAGLQSGYNISRLLISLDGSSDAGIQLPEATRSAQGGIDFFLSDGMFATDEVVEELIVKYSPQGSLVSRSDLDTHVADNADVQQAIQNLNQVLSQSISGIKVTWDSSLSDQGILAHIEARSANLPTSYEHLYLELGTQGDNLYLSQLTYVSTSGDYTSVKLNSSGIPSNVYQKGTAYVFLNMRNTRLEDWVVTSSYRPQQTGYIVDGRGYEARKEARFIAESRSKELVDIVAMMSDTGITDDAMLRLSAAAAGVINSVKCSGESNGACGTLLEEALVYALADNSYAQSTIDWNYAPLSYDLCLPMNIGTPDQNCGFAPSLSQFNLVVSLAYQGFRGVSDWALLQEDFYDNYLYFNMVEDLGDYLLTYAKSCRVAGGLKDLGDGSYYVHLRIIEDGCQLNVDEISGVRGISCQIVRDGLPTQDDCDTTTVFQPLDWEQKKVLADQVFNQYLRNGIGIRFLENGSRDDLVLYHDDSMINHQADPSWWEVISNVDRVDDAEFYMDLFAPMGATPLPYSSYQAFGRGSMFSELNVDDSTGLAELFSEVDGIYRNAEGTETFVSVVIGSEFYKP